MNGVSFPNEDYIEGAVMERRHGAGKDFDVPVLAGHGDTDYARYMRTGALLSLRVLEQLPVL